MHRARSTKAMSMEASVPVESGVHHPGSMGSVLVHPPEA